MTYHDLALHFLSSTLEPSTMIEVATGFPWEAAALVALGAVVGTFLTLIVFAVIFYVYLGGSLALWQAQDRRKRLPRTIILIRHGESKANVDTNIWKLMPDNLVGLTSRGRKQASQIGRRVEALLSRQTNPKCARVHLVVSPFERALQTASCMRPAFEHRIVRTDIESRIREQEMGNLQGDEFQKFRQEQKKVGRFWYRFPTGESGSDVFDRVKSWWYESVLTVNTRVGYERVDAMVVVTHGLTIRFILMQLFNWSPTTFHSVYNAENCAMYVLQKDLTKPGFSPYVLDKENGDMPRSSIDVMVKLKRSGETRLLKLEEYLSIPPPRTTQIALIKHMLEIQHPDMIKADEIDTIVFMPFVQGDIVIGRSTSGVCNNGKESPRQVMFPAKRKVFGARSNKIYRHVVAQEIDDTEEENDEDNGNDQDHDDNNNNTSNNDDEYDDDGDDEAGGSNGKDEEDDDFDESAASDPFTMQSIHFAKKEMSSRFPYIDLPEIPSVDKRP